MKPFVVCCLGIVVTVAGSLLAESNSPFVLASPAVVGPPEVGFDSQLRSAGRADPAFNGSTSLPVRWSGLPSGTKALALVYDDPDDLAEAIRGKILGQAQLLLSWSN